MDPGSHPENDRFITTFGELAGELEMAIGITFLEAASAGPRNTLLLFDRHGGKALSYSKVHTCDFDVERHLVPGSDFPVAELDTATGKVKTGAMICYDRGISGKRKNTDAEGARRSFWFRMPVPWRSTGFPS